MQFPDDNVICITYYHIYVYLITKKLLYVTIDFSLLTQTLFKLPVYSALNLNDRRGSAAKDILDSDGDIVWKF